MLGNPSTPAEVGNYERKANLNYNGECHWARAAQQDSQVRMVEILNELDLETV